MKDEREFEFHRKLYDAYHFFFETKGYPPAGLCDECEHSERNYIRFINCKENETDPDWPKHPKLPLEECERFCPRSSAE